MARLRNRADINYFFDTMRVKYLNKLINGTSGMTNGINGGFFHNYLKSRTSQLLSDESCEYLAFRLPIPIFNFGGSGEIRTLGPVKADGLVNR